MIKMLNETKKRLIYDIENMYLDCKCIIRIKDVIDEECDLIAISNNIEDYKELCELSHKLQDNDEGYYYVVVGSYNTNCIPLLYECKGD